MAWIEREVMWLTHLSVMNYQIEGNFCTSILYYSQRIYVSLQPQAIKNQSADFYLFLFSIFRLIFPFSFTLSNESRVVVFPLRGHFANRFKNNNSNFIASIPLVVLAVNIKICRRRQWTARHVKDTSQWIWENTRVRQIQIENNIGTDFHSIVSNAIAVLDSCILFNVNRHHL